MLGSDIPRVGGGGGSVCVSHKWCKWGGQEIAQHLSLIDTMG